MQVNSESGGRDEGVRHSGMHTLPKRKGLPKGQDSSFFSPSTPSVPTHHGLLSRTIMVFLGAIFELLAGSAPSGHSSAKFFCTTNCCALVAGDHPSPVLCARILSLPNAVFNCWAFCSRILSSLYTQHHQMPRCSLQGEDTQCSQLMHFVFPKQS